MSALHVMSGKCRLCTTGFAAGARDMEGKELFTGDIVVTFTNRDGPEYVGALTVIVRDEFTSYSDGSVVTHAEPGECYAMGIKSVALDEPGYWRCWKVKDHRDVIPGEHWSAYGFSYQAAEVAA